MNLEKFFKLKEHGTTVGTEINAGITTFMTMGYIFIINPQILSSAGMDPTAVFFATVISGVIATLAMAFMANYPFALAAGMGLNAFFAFSVASVYGWEVALLAVFIEGIIFILLSFLNVREAIFDAIPSTLKHSVTVGLGLFIAFIGLTQSGIVVPNPDTTLALGDFSSITVLLTIIGVMVTLFLLLKEVKGAILVGIVTTYVLGIICQMTGLYVPNPEIGMYSLYPTNSAGQFAIAEIPKYVGGYNLFAALKSGAFTSISILDLLPILFTLLFVDIFDTIGTLIGVSTKAGLLDKDGKLPRVKPALLADAIGTTVGGVLGTSTVTTYVESSAGVAAGGRTGLTSVVVAICMALTLFFIPLVGAIPSFATAPALIVVGIFMFDAIRSIKFDHLEETIPAFVTIVMMPLTYNVSTGLAFGFISYVLVKLAVGKKKEVHPLMYIIATIFLIDIFLK
ncbi:MAG: NCS2 family permease [Lachnospirales bacterium]